MFCFTRPENCTLLENGFPLERCWNRIIF
uniref:Uncharacterized protein n=1 Tax=Rhizophora mucronata TaxID=61149 RepID=A0A2P2PK95_RHIMU